MVIKYQGISLYEYKWIIPPSKIFVTNLRTTFNKKHCIESMSWINKSLPFEFDPMKSKRYMLSFRGVSALFGAGKGLAIKLLKKFVPLLTARRCVITEK